MRRTINSAFLVVSLLTASAYGQQHESQKTAPAAPVPSQVPNAAQIRIGPGDLIQVSVYDEPTLEQTIRVNDKGDADLLLLGTQHLAGLSTSEAVKLAEKLLKERNFLLDPHVSMLISEYQAQEVSVLGAVQKPGPYQILGPRNLLDVMSMAGGTTSIASTTVTIKRHSGSQETVKTNLTNDADQILASEVTVEPGDTIVVPRAGIVYVLGEVGRPGAFIMQDDGAMSLTQAVAFAAGVTHEASETKARVIRKSSTGAFNEQVINLKRILEGKDPDPGLHAEDIIYVPSSAIKSMMARAPNIAQSAASAAVYEGMMALP